MAQTHAVLIPAALVGNPLTKRDWGHVRDFVRGMWMSLQVESPDDYVFATGVTHTIKDFVDCGFFGLWGE
jgi:GDPmannose 4,6-dehydratase